MRAITEPVVPGGFPVAGRDEWFPQAKRSKPRRVPKKIPPEASDIDSTPLSSPEGWRVVEATEADLERGVSHDAPVVAGPDLPRTMQNLKRHTAQALLSQVQQEGGDWLINRLEYSCLAHKRREGSAHQAWQEGYHPQSIGTDEMMLQNLMYIHLNPVRRGLVASPEHWRYSSAHEWLPASFSRASCG